MVYNYALQLQLQQAVFIPCTFVYTRYSILPYSTES